MTVVTHIMKPYTIYGVQMLVSNKMVMVMMISPCPQFIRDRCINEHKIKAMCLNYQEYVEVLRNMRRDRMGLILDFKCDSV